MKNPRVEQIPAFRTSWHHYRAVLVVVAIGIVLTILAVTFQQKYRTQQIAARLALRANDEAAHIKQQISKIVEIMESIRNLYAASQFVDRNEFHMFVKDQFNKHTEIRALEWAPLVRQEDRAAFERDLSRIISGRRITELSSKGVLAPAVAREEYFPVFYVEPLGENESALGYDLASNPVRAKALTRAAETNSISFSEKITLVQSGGTVNGILLFQPVFQNTQSSAATANTLSKLLGFVIGVIEPDKLVLSSIHNFTPTGLDIMLVNHIDDTQSEILHFHPSRSRTQTIPTPSLNEFLEGLHYQVDLGIPGSHWVLYFRPTEVFLSSFDPSQAWFILLAGVVLTSLLAYNLTKHVHYTQDALHQAQHDALTGLPNRTLFKQKLDQLISQNKPTSTQSAIFFLDLDNFKHINDSLGHATGDKLLIDISRRLQNHTRTADTVARMGGDEFILLIDRIPQKSDIVRLAQKLLQEITSPYHIDERTFYISASIGVSLYPHDAKNADALIAHADAAMYRAKARGRNTFDFYSTDLTTMSMQRMQLEHELRQAVINKTLDVYYQPQINLASKRVIGAEALARWKHPEHGFVSPQDFIPVAEDSGLIVEIGEWILQRACTQAKSWLNSGIRDFTIAINVSSIQLQRSDFVLLVQRTLQETGLPAQNLELELTESVIMAQPEQTIETLRKLNALGVTLAIDDFGTGFSSLATLKRLPIDKLKIDRSFIQQLPDDEENAAIISAIIALSNSLGLTVTAEGIETQAQNDFIKNLGCHEAQGYHFGRPVPYEEFSFLIEKKST